MSAGGNPLLVAWTAPQGLPPFAAVEPAHFAPAFEVAMAEHRVELDAIGSQPDAPSFANTAAALDATGRKLARIEALFHTLNASASTPELQTVQRAMAAPLAAHASWVAMHAGVFRRLDALVQRIDSLDLAAFGRTEHAVRAERPGRRSQLPPGVAR